MKVELRCWKPQHFKALQQVLQQSLQQVPYLLENLEYFPKINCLTFLQCILEKYFEIQILIFCFGKLWVLYHIVEIVLLNLSTS